MAGHDFPKSGGCDRDRSAFRKTHALQEKGEMRGVVKPGAAQIFDGLFRPRPEDAGGLCGGAELTQMGKAGRHERSGEAAAGMQAGFAEPAQRFLKLSFRKPGKADAEDLDIVQGAKRVQSQRA
ncbi:MAG: hypothetical protein SNJ79_12045, partial [Sphingomonadaceae bacterium]